MKEEIRNGCGPRSIVAAGTVGKFRKCQDHVDAERCPAFEGITIRRDMKVAAEHVALGGCYAEQSRQRGHRRSLARAIVPNEGSDTGFEGYFPGRSTETAEISEGDTLYVQGRLLVLVGVVPISNVSSAFGSNRPSGRIRSGRRRAAQLG